MLLRALPLVLSVVLAAPALAAAQEPAGPAGTARIAPLLDEQTIAVVHVDLSKVDPASLARTFGKMGGMDAKELAQAEAGAKQMATLLKGLGVREFYGVVSMADLPFDPIFLAVPADDVAENLAPVEQLLKNLRMNAELKKIRGFIVAGSKKTLQRLEAEKSKADPMFAKALAAADKSDVQVVVVLPPHLRKAVKELVPQLPKELGGKKVAPLMDGFRWAVVELSLQPPLSLNVTVQTTSAKSAKELNAIVDDGLRNLKKVLADQLTAPQIDKVIELLTPKVEKDRLVVQLTQQDVVPLLPPLVAKVRVAAARTQSANNLKQIALACHVYHDVHKAFPTQASYDKNGKALLSWRVHILPFIEQDNLYKQFKLDEPWDSPHNKKLIAKMPPIFQHPKSKAPPGKTIYLAPIGPSSIIGRTPTQMRDIKDGTSLTILVIEAADDKAVWWTQPEDLSINTKQPLKGLGNFPPGMFQAAMADGSVRVISRTVDPKVLNAAFTKDQNDDAPEK